MAGLQTLQTLEFKVSLSVKFHPTTSYFFLVWLLLLAVPFLVQALEFVNMSILEPVQLTAPAEHQFCYFFYKARIWISL